MGWKERRAMDDYEACEIVDKLLAQCVEDRVPEGYVLSGALVAALYSGPAQETGLCHVGLGAMNPWTMRGVLHHLLQELVNEQSTGEALGE